MGVHLRQHSAYSVVLHAQLFYPLLVVRTRLVRDGHVLKLGFLCEINAVHRTTGSCRPLAVAGNGIISIEFSFCLKLRFLSDYVSRSGLFLDQLLAAKAGLGGDDHLYILVAKALDGSLFVHVVGSSNCVK